MQPIRTALVLPLLLAPALAQTPQSSPRSLADGLVRQAIEREGLTPPPCQSGLEIGAGKGPMVLLIRRAGGELATEAIVRGSGDHGAAAEKRELQPVTEVAEQPKAARPVAKASEPQPHAATAPAQLQLGRDEAQTVLATRAQPRLLVGLDRERLRPLLPPLFAATEGSQYEAKLELAIDADVPMQDVLLCWELARDAGFDTLLLNPLGREQAASASDRELIAGLPAKYGWEVQRRGPGGIQPVCQGELLIALDGTTRFGEVSPLIRELARAGIWQFGFVGQKDRTTRFKLPTNLPFDKGF